MTNRQVTAMAETMEAIEAQNQLRSYRVQDWSNMKDNVRRKEHKTLFGIAYPRWLRENKVMTADAIHNFFRKFG